MAKSHLPVEVAVALIGAMVIATAATMIAYLAYGTLPRALLVGGAAFGGGLVVLRSLIG